MADLDKKIEGVLLQRLTQIIHVWSAEFDDDGDIRRDLRDITNKRRGDKRLKEEKVGDLCVVPRRKCADGYQSS